MVAAEAVGGGASGAPADALDELSAVEGRQGGGVEVVKDQVSEVLEGLHAQLVVQGAEERRQAADVKQVVDQAQRRLAQGPRGRGGHVLRYGALLIRLVLAEGLWWAEGTREREREGGGGHRTKRGGVR